MLSFKVVRWKNFLSTGNVFAEIPLDNKKMSLIVGDNGAGKSQMLDALCFALFNKPFRKINKPALVNSINGKHCVVEVEFETDGQAYKIVRGMKPNVFEIHQNGVLINQTAANRDYQEMLEKQIMKMTYKSFTQIVILGAATFTPFMRLTPADRREVLDDLLDIQIFTTMLVLAKQRAADTKTELSLIDNSIGAQKDKIRYIRDQIDELKKNSDNYKKRLADELESHSAQFSEYTNYLDAVKSTIAEKQALIMEENSLHEKLNDLLPLHTKIHTKIGRLEKQIKFYDTHDHCDQCLQEIDEEFKADIIGKNQSEVAELNKGFTKLVTVIETTRNDMAEINQIKKDISGLETNRKVFESRLKVISNQIEKINSELSTINEDGMSTLLEKTVNDLHKEEKNYKDSIKKKDTLIRDRETIDLTIQVLKDGGIKTQIVKQYLPIINQTINKYLAAMDFMVNFYLDENFSETIKSRFRDDFSYANFSEGEKARIDLSLLLTWRLVAKMRNSVHTNLLILDEVLDSSMDTTGTEQLVEILKDILKDSNVFIISHRESMRENFDNIIRVTKTGNFSEIKMAGV